MRLQNLVLTTNVAGIKILTCTNDDIMDNMKLYLRQGVSQYTVTGVKTGNVYKFTFPVLDFGIVRMQFVSTRGTQVRASTIFSTMIEDNVVSEPGIEYAKATDLTAVDDKYKIITDNLTGILNLHKTNYNTFHDDQIIFNNNTTTDISNYKLATNTSITNINTTLNGMYTKTEVNTLISNTNSSVDTKLQSYYNKTEVDNKLSTLDLTNYALKSTVYTKSETNALFTPYYTKTNVDDKFVLYYTKSNVNSLFANDRLSNDGRYVLKDDYDTYTSTIYTKSEIDNKVSNINTQITGLTNNINTLNTTVGDNYTNLDGKYVALNIKVENYNSTQTTKLNAYKTIANGNISALDTNVTNITTNLNDNYYNKTQIDTKLGSVNKIETTVGTTADTNYDADYAGKFNLRSQDDGSLLLNIGATASVTAPNSISNIQLKTDVFGQTWVRYYSTQSGVQKFSTWDRLAYAIDVTDTNTTVTNISTSNINSTAIYGTYLEGIRGNINTNNHEMWFSTHNMTHASLTYTDVPNPLSPTSRLTKCKKISIPIPSWWKFDKLIDLKVECYDMGLGAEIDGVFYTDTLTPILKGYNTPSSITKIDILLTDMLGVHDLNRSIAVGHSGNPGILYDFTNGRVPKIKITGIGKPLGALTTTHNGFTAI